MARPRTLKGLIRRMIEFYETHRWGRYALYTGRGGWCLLGAAAAAMSNEEMIRKAGRGELGGLSSDMKGYKVLREFQDRFKDLYGEDPVSWNDGSARNKGRVVARLNNMLERL